jgi:hypothetical protein
MNKGMLLINFELTLNIIYLEKHVISRIDKMQYILFKGIQYKVCFREYVYIKLTPILSDILS